jgi:hypothetical protein
MGFTPPTISQMMNQRPAPDPRWSAPALHDRATATIAATRGELPPFPVPFPYPGAAADDAKARATAALPPTPTSTPPRLPTSAEKAFAALPDAAEVVAEKIDRADRMWRAATPEEADAIRFEGAKGEDR